MENINICSHQRLFSLKSLYSHQRLFSLKSAQSKTVMHSATKIHLPKPFRSVFNFENYSPS